MSTDRWERPAAGREPAAAGLLAWLTDVTAPRMCLLTGSAGCGKSTLLAWLVVHGSRPGTPQTRRVHAVAPLQGLGVRSAVWSLANQLGVVARAPGELVASLAADQRPVTIVLPDLDDAAEPLVLADLISGLLQLGHIRLLVETATGSPAMSRLAALAPAVMNLDHGQWTDAERLSAWRAALPQADSASTLHRLPAINLDDPGHVSGADPMDVTASYEDSDGDHGGLRAAWLRSGQSLIRETQPTARALTLLAALGDSSDPRIKQELTVLAADSDWAVVWSRVAGDVNPPWPGPVLCLAAGLGTLVGKVLLGDHHGVVRVIEADSAVAAGRLPRPFVQTQALAVLPEGTVLTFDMRGHLEWQQSIAARRPSRLSTLLEDGPTPLEQLAHTLNSRLSRTPGRVLATAASGLLAVGDEAGVIHVASLQQPTARPHTVALHDGPVTALATLDLAAAHEGSMPLPLLYSGGVDGRVRAWAPGKEPLTEPVAERSFPVSALAAAHTSDGPVLAIGWADGLVEYHRWSTGARRAFRPGPPIHSLAVTEDADLVIGSDEMVLCLRPR